MLRPGHADFSAFYFSNFRFIKNISFFYHKLKSVSHRKSHLEAEYNSKTNKIQYTIKSKMYYSRNTEGEIIEMRSHM